MAHQTIQRGSKGPEVKAAQQELIARFYPCGPAGADGIFGPHTLRAVIDYQDDRDAPNYAAYTMPLAVDGVVGIHTWARLDPDPIKNGDTGALVMLLQAILKDYGYLLAVPDGVFGNLTETAVKAFQADYSLPVSGKVGKDEWQKLQS